MRVQEGPLVTELLDLAIVVPVHNRGGLCYPTIGDTNKFVPAFTEPDDLPPEVVDVCIEMTVADLVATLSPPYGIVIDPHSETPIVLVADDVSLLRRGPTR
jgi:hypothetical protein